MNQQRRSSRMFAEDLHSRHGSARQTILESVRRTKAATILQYSRRAAAFSGDFQKTGVFQQPQGCMTCSSLSRRLSWWRSPEECAVERMAA